MIEYIKAKNHKGIDELKFLNLGHINILCGKNNSGKTSILEAIVNDSTFSLGKKVVDLELLERIFTPESKRYGSPSPQHAMSWFKRYVSNLKRENTIWFSDEKRGIVQGFADDMQNDRYLVGHGPGTYSFDIIHDLYFEEDQKCYKPVLIPPKRNLETKTTIKLNQEIEASGKGLLNRWFFLRNQDLESAEFKTFEKIYKAFSEITGHSFNIIPDQDNYITLYFRRGEDDWIASDACGLGLSDILVIVAFTLDFDYNFILIEEPESHVHPDMQRKLLHFLHRNVDKQFFLSTHSNIFLDSAIVDKVFFSSFNDSVEISDATSKSSILFELGYSVTDNLVSDLVILVEGPTDIPIIEEFLIKMDLHETFDIKIWPLGGDIMDQLDLSVFAQNYTILALVDQDPKSDHVRKIFLANCKKYSIPVTRLKRYAIENYFSVSALKEVFGAQFPKSITNIDPDIKLKDQIKIDVRKNNKKIAQAMTIEDIKDTDLHKFFKNVQKTLQEADKT